LPAAAHQVFATGGVGGVPTDFDRRRRRHWKTGGGGVRRRYGPTYGWLVS